MGGEVLFGLVLGLEDSFYIILSDEFTLVLCRTHAIALSRAGVSQVTGLDISDEMLGYARWRSDIGVDGKAGSSSRSLSFVKGDMTDFDLGKEHDMVICLLGTFSHMLSNEDASRAMACISRALRPGGVLLIELGHPGDLFDGSYVIGDCGKDMWEVPLSLPNGAPSQHKILVEWGAEFDEFDSVSQVVNRTVSVTTFCGEKVEDSLEEVVSQRQFTVQEIKLLGSINGLELDVQNGLYGEMDPSLNVGLRHEEAYRMIAVLKKTQ